MDENEDEYEWPSDDGKEEEGDEAWILVENTYYDAEDKKKTKPQDALEMFDTVVMLEEQIGAEVRFRFKALENGVILSSVIRDFDGMIQRQTRLLKLINKVARNDVSDAMNNILDAISQNLQQEAEQQKKMYQMTLETLRNSNERLWFNMSLRLAKIYLDCQQYEQLDLLLTELKDSCRLEGQDYDPTKGNLLLEAFALEIQMCVQMKDSKRMKRVYPQTTSLNAVINDPRVVGIIKECGGKMYMSEKKWDKALEELFESFKNYQESGNFRAKTVLKYVILASMLSGSEINYAGTREAKVYGNQTDIMAIINLRTAYENNDINLIQQILKDNKKEILDDPFINTYLDDLLRNIRLNVLEAKVKPYKIVKIEYLSQQLSVNLSEIRSLLQELILEDRIKGEIDQLNGYLWSIQDKSQKYDGMKNWAKVLGELHTQLIQKY